MQQAQINGIQIGYDVLGEGEPIAFLNGLAMTTVSWAGQTEFLQKHYQCILQDFRGQLASEKPDNGYTSPQIADDCAKLLDHLGVEACHLVGTSFGGVIAQTFAINYPYRVKSLVLIATASAANEAIRSHIAEWITYLENTDYHAFLESLKGLSYSDQFLADNEALVQQRFEQFKQLPEVFFRGLIRLLQVARDPQLTDKVGQLTCPVLIVYGEQDKFVAPQLNRELARSIPTSEILMIPDAGHAAVMEKAGIDCEPRVRLCGAA
jgi:3-oxoadipate enol-lactonase